MTLISIRFWCIFIKPLRNFIGLNFKLFKNQINIFEANIKGYVMSITCYVNWFTKKKGVTHVNIKKEWA